MSPAGSYVGSESSRTKRPKSALGDFHGVFPSHPTCLDCCSSRHPAPLNDCRPPSAPRSKVLLHHRCPAACTQGIVFTFPHRTQAVVRTPGYHDCRPPCRPVPGLWRHLPRSPAVTKPTPTTQEGLSGRGRSQATSPVGWRSRTTGSPVLKPMDGQIDHSRPNLKGGPSHMARALARGLADV